MSLKASIGLFISPRGEIFSVRDGHISTLIADPEKFGLTTEKIRNAYSRHGERIGIEGEARKELLLKVVQNGWIRLRRYPNHHWSATLSSLTPSVRKLMRDWAEKMLAGTGGFKEPDRYMPVKIDTSEGQTYCTIGELADGSSFF